MSEVRSAILADWNFALPVALLVWAIFLAIGLLPDSAHNFKHSLLTLTGVAAVTWFMLTVWTVSVLYPGWPTPVLWIIWRLAVCTILVCGAPAFIGWLVGLFVLYAIQRYRSGDPPVPPIVRKFWRPSPP
jgi:hypothetical protein